jgi:hypothetical protein
MKKNIEKLFLLIAILFSVSVIAQGYDEAINPSNPTGEEGEAHIIMNPLDSNKLVVGYMDSGSPLGFKIFRSIDGGNTWEASQFNPASAMQSTYPGYVSAGGGDIVFAYDKQANLYCTWLYLLANPTNPNYLANLLWRAFWAKSTDNGMTFTMEEGDNKFFGKGKLDLSDSDNPSVVDEVGEESGLTDRQWMAVDMSNGSFNNRMYLAFLSIKPDGASGLFVKTFNYDNMAFENSVMAYGGAAQSTNIGVDGNGTLHYTFIDTDSNNLMYVNSIDGGQSFSNAHLVNAGVFLGPPIEQSDIVVNARESASPSLAIDGDNNLHLVWGDFGNSQVKSYYTKSTDNGQNWSEPLSLSELFENDTPFMPVVSANGKRISIGANIIDENQQSKYKIISSTDYGQNFSSPKIMSSGAMDLQEAGKGVFLGDYSTSVRTYCNVYSVWTHCEGQDCRLYLAKYNECNTSNLVEHTPFNSTFFVQNIYPNPVKDQLSLNIQSEKKDYVNCEVISITGQSVEKGNYDLNIGQNTLSFDVSSLANGSYLIKLSSSSGHFISRSFVKQ